MKKNLKIKEQPDWVKMDNLIPAIAQDVNTGRVLMIAYMNPYAWEATLSSGQAHFWSRSRKKLWKKGETSGNILNVSEVSLDCDSDSILLLCLPSGPSCHKGTRSCFFSDNKIQNFEFLLFLQDVIQKRILTGSERSYVRHLVEKNESEAAKKVGEEAMVVILASRQSNTELVSESADLIFHLLVLLAQQGVGLDEVITELLKRRPKEEDV